MFLYKCTIFREHNKNANWEADKTDENCGHPFTSLQTTAHRLSVQDTKWHYAVTLFSFATALYMDVPWKFCLTWGGYSLTYFEWKMLYQHRSKCELSYYPLEQIAHISTRRAKSHACPLFGKWFISSLWIYKFFVMCLSVHENHFTEDGNCCRHHHE